MSTNIKPTHRAIKIYYEELARIHAQGATHEGATSTAFYNLLAETVRLRKWDAIHQLGAKHQGDRIVPHITRLNRQRMPHPTRTIKRRPQAMPTQLFHTTSLPARTPLRYPLPTAILFFPAPHSTTRGAP